LDRTQKRIFLGAFPDKRLKNEGFGELSRSAAGEFFLVLKKTGTIPLKQAGHDFLGG